MGVHISIKDSKTWADTEGWDWCRHAGDGDVTDVLYELPTDRIAGDDYDAIVRPRDVSAFRQRLRARMTTNFDRWEKMCDLLEADSTRGLHFSY